MQTVIRGILLTCLGSALLAQGPKGGYSPPSGGPTIWTDDGTTVKAPAGRNVAIGPSVLGPTGVLDGGGQVYNVQAYGIYPDNTDRSTQFAALLTTVYNAGGGIIFFPGSLAANKYRLNACFTLPNNGATLPSQPPLQLVGAGASPNHSENGLELPYGGAILDVRCTSGTATIDTRGKGLLDVSGLSFVNGGTGAIPFIATTNTIVRIHDNYFYGQAALVGQSNNQDAIILGGLTRTEDGTASAPFQGYGTAIERNHFDHVRRGVYARTYSNGVIISGNDSGFESGSDTTGAFIELAGQPAGVPMSGAIVENNIIEMTAYAYGIKVTNAQTSTIVGNGCYDTTALSVACVRFEAASIKNLLIHGLAATDNGAVATSDANGTNTVLQAGDKGLNSQFDVTANAPTGDATLSTSLAGVRKWSWYTTSANGSMGLYDWANSTFRFKVTNTGFVGIGLGAALPLVPLHVIGTTYLNGAVFTNSISPYSGLARISHPK